MTGVNECLPDAAHASADHRGRTNHVRTRRSLSRGLLSNGLDRG